jgi:hypothetical protein
VDKDKRRVDWHRVTFWACIGVMTVWLSYMSVHPEHRLVTVFSERGRDELKTYVRYNYPKIADRWGLNEVHTVPSSR